MWVWPIGIQNNLVPVISDGYHLRSNGIFHYGVDVDYQRPPDIAVAAPWSTQGYYTPQGTKALAANDGTVTISSDIGTGGYIQIDHGDGFVTQYMHLSQRFKNVGDAVASGDAIGIVGYNPQDPAFAHLHFELLVNGSKVDPANYMSQWQIIDQPSDMNNLLIAVAVFAGAYLLFG